MEQHEHDAQADLSPRTKVVALGRPQRSPGASLNPPVTFTSTYIQAVSYTHLTLPTKRIV